MAEEVHEQDVVINGHEGESGETENKTTNHTKPRHQHHHHHHKDRKQETVYSVIHRMIFSIFLDQESASTTAFLQRVKAAVSHNVPLLKEASRNSVKNLLDWTRRGSPLRALLVISVGTIVLLTLTGLLVFMLFFLAATFNAIVISLFISLATAGGFLALFFACVTAVYIGALSIAVFVISTATISAIAAVVIATGWVGFFCVVWLATKKTVGVAKHSLRVTGSAISTYASARHPRRHPEPDKVSN